MHAADHYRNASQAGLTGPALVAGVLSRCARDLAVAAEDTASKDKTWAALDRNRDLWSIIGADFVPASSGLPPDARRNLATLTTYMMDRYLGQLQAPDRQTLLGMARINLDLAAGFRESLGQRTTESA